MELELLTVIVAVIVAFLAGAAVALYASRHYAKSTANAIVHKAKMEAEVLRNNEVMKGKEEALDIRTKADKEANQRLQKVQASEAKLKQREIQLNQQQGDLNRGKKEVEQQRAANEQERTRLENQDAAMQDRLHDLERQEKTIQDTLEHVSGLSADEARHKAGSMVEVCHGPLKGLTGRLVRENHKYFLLKEVPGMGVMLKVTRWCCKVLA